MSQTEDVKPETGDTPETEPQIPPGPSAGPKPEDFVSEAVTGQEETSAADEAADKNGTQPATPAGRVTEGLYPPPSTIGDGVNMRESYAVSLEMFEGPLDLLLHLVRRHELDILDIPIAFVTEKYIEYLEFARALDLEIAGEYLVMAATLAYLKSRELLPPDPTEEEEAEGELESVVDPREELIRRLLEYERFRHAGDELNQRAVMGRDVFVRGGEVGVDPEPPGLAPITLFRLAEAYNRVLDKAEVRQSHDVVIEPVTVRERISQLGLMLRDAEELDFEKMFLEQTWGSQNELRQMLVVTLMSILEMVKMGIMGIHQAQGSSTLSLTRIISPEDVVKEIETFQGGSFED
jgi:segregation and condensation protein A